MPFLFTITPILDGSKTAVLQPVVLHDHFKRHPDDTWHHNETLETGNTVHAIRQVGRFVFAQGELCTFKSLKQPCCEVQVMITEIHLVRVGQLTEAQRAELGPRETQPGIDQLDRVSDLDGWFIRFIPAAENTRLH